MRIPATLFPFNSFHPFPAAIQRKTLRLDLYTQGAVKFLARYHARLIIAFGLLIIALQTIEHLTLLHAARDFYLIEVLLTVLVLTGVWFLIRKLLATIGERANAYEILRLKHDLGMYLSASQDVNEVIRRLVEQVGKIAPTAQVELYTYGNNRGAFQRVFGSAGILPAMPVLEDPNRPVRFDQAACQQCLERQSAALNTCLPFGCCARQKPRNHYCFPLVQGPEAISLLHLYTPARAPLSEHQIVLLTSTIPEMANSLNLAMEKKDREEEMIAQKVRTIQLDIARDLHDTIGQNISYLRMRLDYLADGKMQAGPGSPGLDANAELRQMVAVANESYDLVRGTLAVLQLDDSDGLRQLFNRYAAQIGGRSGIAITVNEQGEPRPLQPGLIRQLFYIIREALNNIEKYANASQVRIDLAWQETSLGLSITDDGRGFDPNHLPSGDHYGLQFVRERVENLCGSLAIQSAIGAGTSLRVRVPWKQEQFAEDPYLPLT